MNNKNTEYLMSAILSLKTQEEARNFMRDLMTEKEIIEIGNRLCAAKMLMQKIPYSKIEKETGLSSTTIARISKWLFYGMNGYKIVLSRISHEHENHINSGKRHRP